MLTFPPACDWDFVNIRAFIIYYHSLLKEHPCINVAPIPTDIPSLNTFPFFTTNRAVIRLAGAI